jgi:hypothetical protein
MRLEIVVDAPLYRFRIDGLARFDIGLALELIILCAAPPVSGVG